MNKVLKSLIIERTLLNFKIHRLHEFLKTDIFKSLNETEQEGLLEQEVGMKAYSDALFKRINNIKENFEVDEETLTKGEEVIGLFGAEHELVKELKLNAIHLIDYIDSISSNSYRKAKAFTDIETGVMFAVKSLFIK